MFFWSAAYVFDECEDTIKYLQYLVISYFQHVHVKRLKINFVHFSGIKFDYTYM